LAAAGVYYTPRALADLRRLHRFLKRKSPRAADRAISTVHTAVRRLISFPESGRPIPDGDSAHRELLVRFGRSGYVVIYGFDKNDIVVVSIHHQSEAGY